MRLLTSITMIFVVLTISWQARAAGMGDINVFSALNEPLKAEIAVQLHDPSEANNLKVSIGKDQGFSDSEINTTPSDLMLELRTSNTGNPVVVLTTRSAIVEPAITIFVLLESNASRILREYTLLLDLNAPSDRGETTALENSSSIKNIPEQTQQSATARSNLTNSTPRNAANIYTPAKNETLWSIADKLRPNQNTSIQIMIKAIADANPTAFNHGNINSIKSGFVLKVPQASDTATIAHEQALAYIDDQNIAWQRLTASNFINTQPATTKPITSMQVDREPISLEDNKSEVSVGNNDNEKKELLTKIALLEAQLNVMENLLVNADEEINKQSFEQASGPIGLDAIEMMSEPATTVNETDTTFTAVDSETQMNSQAEEITTRATTEESLQNTATSPMTDVAIKKPVVTIPVQNPEPIDGISAIELPASVNDIIKIVSENNTIIAMGAGLLLLIGVFTTYRAKRNAEQMATHAVSATPEYTQTNDLYTEEAAATLESLSVDESIENETLDRMVEVDVYLAYGRYKEAEALTNEGIAEDPTRPDYYLKLFEIYKASENTVSFEAEAETFYSGLASDYPEAWEKIAAMGKILCPNHPLFINLEEQSVVDEQINSTSNDMDNFLADASIDDNDISATKDQPSEIEFTLEETDTALEPQSNQEESNVAFDEAEDIAQPDEYTNSTKDTSPEIESEVLSAMDDDGIDFEIANEEPTTNKPELKDESRTIEHDINQEIAELNESISEIESENSIDLELEESLADIADNELTEKLTEELLIETGAAEYDNNNFDQLLENDSYLNSDPLAQLSNTMSSFDEVENASDDGEYLNDHNYEKEAIETKLDLVRAYIEMDDRDEARRILDEILAEGSEEQKNQAQALKQEIA